MKSEMHLRKQMNNKQRLILLKMVKAVNSQSKILSLLEIYLVVMHLAEEQGWEDFLGSQTCLKVSNYHNLKMRKKKSLHHFLALDLLVHHFLG